MKFVNYNGKLHPADSPIFKLYRAINYGDGFFESIRIHHGEILFFDDHMDRLFRAMQSLKMSDVEQFTGAFLYKQITDLAREEEVGANARIRIGIFRGGKGLYEPVQNNSEYFIEVLPLKNAFEWNGEPCRIGVFEETPKNFSSISFFKSMNALPSVMASIYKKEKNLDDCLLLNSFGKIADAISSNVFWIVGRNVFSPPSSDGGVEGIMRKQIIRLLQSNHFFFEEKSATPLDLKLAHEVFLTNVGWGIKPVTHFEAVTYSSKITREIYFLLQHELT